MNAAYNSNSQQCTAAAAQCVTHQQVMITCQVQCNRPNWLQHGCLGHTHDNKPGAQPAGEPGGKRMHVCTCTSQDHPPNTTRYDQEPGHLHTKQLCCCMQSQAVLRQACPFDCTCHRRSMRLCPKRLFQSKCIAATLDIAAIRCTAMTAVTKLAHGASLHALLCQQRSCTTWSALNMSAVNIQRSSSTRDDAASSIRPCRHILQQCLCQPQHRQT